MAKLLVELKTASLLDLAGKQYVLSGKPQVVNSTPLINAAIAD